MKVGRCFAAVLASCLLTPGLIGALTDNERMDGKDSWTGQLKKFVQQQVSEDKFSGVVLVARSGKPVLAEAFGMADKKSKTANRVDTKFDLGSMPKMFTAVAIAQLAEAGKLNYSDPIIKYLPDYPDKAIAQRVKIHQLLTHTAGFGNYFRPGFLSQRLTTVKQYFAFVAAEPLVGDPEGKFEYSNSGYVVLGAIVESVSGQDFYDYVRDHVFQPSGMANSAYYNRDEHIENAATAYTTGQGLMMLRQGQQQPRGVSPQGGRVVGEPSGPPTGSEAGSKSYQDASHLRPYRGSPAGGAYSTALDLLNFVEALENHKLIGARSVDMLQKGKVSTRPQGPQYGYGFYEWQVDGHRIVGHGGGGPGVNTMLQIYPDLGYTVIVLSNYDPPAAEDVATKARELIIQAADQSTKQ